VIAFLLIFFFFKILKKKKKKKKKKDESRYENHSHHESMWTLWITIHRRRTKRKRLAVSFTKESRSNYEANGTASLSTNSTLGLWNYMLENGSDGLRTAVYDRPTAAHLWN